MMRVTFVLLGLFVMRGACASVVLSGNDYGGNRTWNDDVVIADGVNVLPDSLTITKSMQIENYGTLKSDIWVCDRCRVRIKNAGVIDADFYMGDKAQIIQVVSDARDLNPVDFGSDFVVSVEGANGISGDDILRLVNGASALVLTDSVIDITGLNQIDVPVQINGVVDLHAMSGVGLYDAALMKNVSGNGTIRFVIDDNDPMYADVAYVHDGALFARRERETDYSKVLNNDVGEFLDRLRDINADDKLLSALDKAVDMRQLKNIMGKTVRVNPDNLFMVARAINAFSVADASDTGARVFGVLGDVFKAHGIDLNFSDDVYAMRIDVGLRAGNIKYNSDLDEFDGDFWGLKISGNYLMKNNFWIRSDVGATRFNFDVGDVFYNGVDLHNPKMLSVSGIVDAGYIYDIYESCSVAPFVGVGVATYSLGDVARNFVHARVGGNVAYTYKMMGLMYKYNIGAAINSDKEISVMGRVGFMSEYDDMGGDITVGVTRVMGVTAYNLSIGAQIRF